MITVFTGKVRKAKQHTWKTEWYFHLSARNNEKTAMGEGYGKLASAVNAIEGILCGEFRSQFGVVITVKHPDGVIEKLAFVSVNDPRKPRFAYHQRSYGKFVHESESIKPC